MCLVWVFRVGRVDFACLLGFVVGFVWFWEFVDFGGV